jgi:enoyl-CoA hydratase
VIDVEVSEGCALISTADFAPLTRHDGAFARALAAAVIDLSDDDDVKVIVLRAGGPDFAPADRATLARDLRGTVTAWGQDFSASDAIYQALCFSKKVTITEVAGVCSGAGSALVLASDLTISSEDAQFASPFMCLPESNFVLASLTIRLNRAKAWAVRGRPIGADEAMACGLVSRVVSRAGLASATQAAAEYAAAMPLDGIVMSKMLLQAVLDAHGVGREFDMANLYATSQRAAGVTAEEESP